MIFTNRKHRSCKGAKQSYIVEEGGDVHGEVPDK